jgi:hypothetical protein
MRAPTSLMSFARDAKIRKSKIVHLEAILRIGQTKHCRHKGRNCSNILVIVHDTKQQLTSTLEETEDDSKCNYSAARRYGCERVGHSGHADRHDDSQIYHAVSVYEQSWDCTPRNRSGVHDSNLSYLSTNAHR